MGGVIDDEKISDVQTLRAEIFGNIDGLSSRRSRQERDRNFPRGNSIHNDGKSFLVHLLDKLDEIFQDTTSLKVTDRIDAVAVYVNFVMDVRSRAEARGAHVGDKLPALDLLTDTDDDL